MQDRALKTLGSSLKDLRKLHHLSQQEVADKLGIAQTELSQLELGKVRNPSLIKLATLGRIYGVTPTDLAVLAGIWERGEQDNDPHWSLLRDVVRSVPLRYREDLLERIYQFAQSQAYLFLAEEQRKQQLHTQPQAG
jgi:transcriptional regulator with XRE-family HTH domain